MKKGVVIFWAVIIVIVIIAVVVSVAMPPRAATSTGMYTGQTTAALDTADHVRGGTESGITLMEYGDFQCPACGAYEPIVEQIQSDFPQIQFAFRNFPLTQLHPNAMIAAQAAEAAGLQNKYWQMHDLLYQKQTEWADAAQNEVVSKYFDTYAQSLGLDVDKFNTDINSSAVKARVQRDISFANSVPVDHTPTFFINGKEIQNPTSLQQFESFINDALASAKATSTATTTQ